MPNTKCTDEEFLAAIKNSYSIRETLMKLKLNATGSAYRTFKLRVECLSADISHFLGSSHLKGKKHNWAKKIELDKILIENSTYLNGSSLKRRLIAAELLRNECADCGIDKWMGKPLSLQIDHINGNHRDNRINNIRLLCPNCHSLTDTFAGKKLRKNVKGTPRIRNKSNACKECSIQILSKYSVCGKCYREHRTKYQSNYKRRQKIEWPPLSKLILMLEASSYLSVSRKLGVSDNAIRKHIRNLK